jgi:hypothetical protein
MRIELLYLKNPIDSTCQVRKENTFTLIKIEEAPYVEEVRKGWNQRKIWSWMLFCKIM